MQNPDQEKTYSMVRDRSRLRLLEIMQRRQQEEKTHNTVTKLQQQHSLDRLLNILRQREASKQQNDPILHEEIKQKDEKDKNDREKANENQRPFFVYVLESLRTPRQHPNTGRSCRKPEPYIGYTVNCVLTRLQKHNGVRRAGAKRTAMGRPWRLIATVTGDPAWFNKSVAMSLEKCLQMARRWKRRQESRQRRAVAVSLRRRTGRKGRLAGQTSRATTTADKSSLRVPAPFGHAAAARCLDDLFWFFQTRKQFNKDKPDTYFSGEQELRVAVHPDFDPALLARTVAPTCRYWNLNIGPMEAMKK